MSEEKPQPATVSLKVRGQDGSEVFFKLKCTAKLENLMRAYAERQQGRIKDYRFLIDGERLDEKKTPDCYDIEEDDVIDVFVAQTGGA